MSGRHQCATLILMPPTIKRVFPILGLSIFSNALGVGIIAPLLPIYAENLGATGTWLGFIIAGFSISRFIIMPFAGRLSDRRGRKQIMAVGLIAFAITSFGYVWANSTVGLLLVRFLQGIAAGMILPIAQAYVGDIAPEGEEGKWMGFFSAAFFTGLGCGPLMGGILGEHLGMNAAFCAMGGFSLLAFLGVALFLPEVSTRQKTASQGSSFKDIAASKVVQGIFSFRLGYASARGAFSTFLPILAGINLGLSPSLIGVLLAVNVLGMSVLQILTGAIADRFNRRALIVLGSAINLTALAVIHFAGNLWVLLVLCVILGVGGAVAMPAASVLAISQGRRFGMGIVMASLNMALAIGMSVGPILAGVIADTLSVGFVFYFASAVVLIGAIIFSRLTR